MGFARLGVAVVCLALALTACARPEPADANYLDAEQADRAVARLVDEANSDRILEVQLGRQQATVKVAKGSKLRVQTMRAGYQPERLASADLPQRPFIRAKHLDIAKHARVITQYDVVNGCNVNGLRIEVATTRFGPTQTHFACLNDARHVWLDPELRPYQFVDLHNASGIDRALADIRRLSGDRPIYNVALLYGSGGQVSVEFAGDCRNVVDCPAIVASRGLIIHDTPPVSFTEGPARLNYARPMDFSLFSGSSLEAAIRKALQTRNRDFWGQFTVTGYQLEGKAPMLEFKVGKEVFYTDLSGDTIQP